MKRIALAFLVAPCLSGQSPLCAQELAPDDPALAARLGVWFKDAANTFDSETGIWADSGGQGIDAEPIGEVNVGGPVTYAAPVLGEVAGGAFDSGNVPSVRFTGSVDDLLAANDINGGNGLSELTIFAVMNVVPMDSNGLTRPVGIGSVAAIQINRGNNFNLGSDPSIRKDNGQIGAGQYSQGFPSGTTFIRTARMSGTAIDEWFNTDGSPMKVITVTGSSYITSTDDFFLGDLRAGPTAIPGVNGGGTSISDLDVIQTVVYTGALSDAEVMGVNEWLSNNLAGGAPAPEIAITDIQFNEDMTVATLTWRSKPNQDYAIDSSTSLEAPWNEIRDDAPSGGFESSVDVPITMPAPRELFFRVREFREG